MRFNINDYKGKYAMHCKTQEEARSFCDYMHQQGKQWCSGRSYDSDTCWDWYKENMTYSFNEGGYCDIDYYKRHKYTILEWSDFMNHTFTKADLKTGDVIRRRDGRVEIVNLELGVSIGKSCCTNLANIREDLTCVCDSEMYDIVAIRRPKIGYDCQFDAFERNRGTLVYERQEVEEMTLAQVCKALGKNIKIIP